MIVIAGDLADSENKYTEVFNVVESVVTTLVEAEIPLVVVVGNHYDNVLLDLADAIEHLQLLGRNGRWERQSFTGADGNTLLHFDGWSSRSHHESPLATHDLSDQGVLIPYVSTDK